MAWTVRTPSSGKDGAAGTSHTVTLPATVNAGDLIVVIFHVDGNPTVTWDNSSQGTWTALNFSPYQDSTAIATHAYYKSAAGTEDGGTLTITTDVNEAATFVCFAIEGWHGTTAPEGTGFRTTGTTIDPPSHAASWGSAANLWLAIGASDGSSQASGWPAGYSNTGATDNGLSGGTNLGWGTLEATASSEDPAAFTFGASSVKQGFTIAIRPSSGGSSAIVNKLAGPFGGPFRKLT